MGELDQEDLDFLQALAKELRNIDPIYNAEADELENIVYRATHGHKRGE